MTRINKSSLATPGSLGLVFVPSPAISMPSVARLLICIYIRPLALRGWSSWQCPTPTSDEDSQVSLPTLGSSVGDVGIAFRGNRGDVATIIAASWHKSKPPFAVPDTRARAPRVHVAQGRWPEQASMGGARAAARRSDVRRAWVWEKGQRGRRSRNASGRLAHPSCPVVRAASAKPPASQTGGRGWQASPHGAYTDVCTVAGGISVTWVLNPQRRARGQWSGTRRSIAAHNAHGPRWHKGRVGAQLAAARNGETASIKAKRGRGRGTVLAAQVLLKGEGCRGSRHADPADCAFLAFPGPSSRLPRSPGRSASSASSASSQHLACRETSAPRRRNLAPPSRACAGFTPRLAHPQNPQRRHGPRASAVTRLPPPPNPRYTSIHRSLDLLSRSASCSPSACANLILPACDRASTPTALLSNGHPLASSQLYPFQPHHLHSYRLATPLPFPSNLPTALALPEIAITDSCSSPQSRRLLVLSGNPPSITEPATRNVLARQHAAVAVRPRPIRPPVSSPT
ncbi:hypothetical protein PMIN01_00210 [Paraphaeosphaeria minitans]|uniref:Uncharacterized protein n=1 Tax=Paraphaeosphaeria minitans TaxID=565426 RepID=A0A9P6GSQ8_9PLEO|nr:hypothetical protein PMIN01_00210 [Paraphaeosphaeria minitans]